ncbi:MAG: hypothetical protein FWH01_07655 [Oscillospiraceae bacterium]|nr:hypothetical protein [Oscillospiraceae bacterium]
MVLFIGAVILAAAATSLLFIYISKRMNLCRPSLIVAVSALNALFCAAFPPLFALFSGDLGNGMPARGLVAVFAIMALWAVFYVALVIWRVVLRSPSVRLNAPVPRPDLRLRVDNAEMAARRENVAAFDEMERANPEKSVEITPFDVKNMGIDTESVKNSVDTALIIDKMGNIDEMHPNLDNESEKGGVAQLIERAFECLNDGNKEDAAEYFYSAIEKHPPLNLEIQIAIQLGIIYCELERAELAYDILTSYSANYRDRLTDADRETLDTGVSMVESIVAGIGGDGYEKD